MGTPLVYRKIPSQKSFRHHVETPQVGTVSSISQKRIPMSLTEARQLRKKSNTIGRFDPNLSSNNRSQNQSLYETDKSSKSKRKISRIRGSSRELIKRTQKNMKNNGSEMNDESVFQQNDDSMISNISGKSRNKVRMRSRSRRGLKKRQNSVKLSFTPQKKRKAIQRVTPNQSKGKSGVKKVPPKSLRKRQDRGREGYAPGKEAKKENFEGGRELRRRNSDQEVEKQVGAKKAEKVRNQYQSELGARGGLFKERGKGKGLGRMSNHQVIRKDNYSQVVETRKDENQDIGRGRKARESRNMALINESIGISSDEGVGGYTSNVNRSRDVISQKSLGSINNGGSRSRKTSSRRYLEERQKKAWVRHPHRGSESNVKTSPVVAPRRSSKQIPVAVGVINPRPVESPIIKVQRAESTEMELPHQNIAEMQHLEPKKETGKRYPTFGTKIGSRMGTHEIEQHASRNTEQERRNKMTNFGEPSLEKNMILKNKEPKKKEHIELKYGESLKRNVIEVDLKQENVLNMGPSVEFLQEFQSKIKQVTSMRGAQRRRLKAQEEDRKTPEKSNFKNGNDKEQPKTEPELRNGNQLREARKHEIRGQRSMNENDNLQNKIREIEKSVNETHSNYYTENKFEQIENLDVHKRLPNKRAMTFKEESPPKIPLEQHQHQYQHQHITPPSESPRFEINNMKNHFLPTQESPEKKIDSKLSFQEMIEKVEQTDPEPRHTNNLSQMPQKFNSEEYSGDYEIQQLMWLNNKGKIELNEDTLKGIEKLEGHIKVVSVIGPYRSGKSFLLNRLNNSQKGFGIGSTTNPCTQGVWLWGLDEGKEEEREEGAKRCSTVLLDTEGLFAYNRNEVFDSKLFLFTACVSSLMIYNSFGVINESAIEKFNFIINLGKHVQLAKESMIFCCWCVWLKFVWWWGRLGCLTHVFRLFGRMLEDWARLRTWLIVLKSEDFHSQYSIS